MGPGLGPEPIEPMAQGRRAQRCGPKGAQDPGQDLGQKAINARYTPFNTDTLSALDVAQDAPALLANMPAPFLAQGRRNCLPALP